MMNNQSIEAKLKSLLERVKKVRAQVTAPVKPKPTTKPITEPKTPKRDPFKPPRPSVNPKPKAKEERKVAAQSNFSSDTPIFPIRLVFRGEQSTLRSQMKKLREEDTEYSEGTEESESVNDFVDALMTITDNAGRGFRCLNEARALAEDFCEKYPLFRLKDFYIADARDEKFPVDMLAEGQQEIPGILKPHQWTIPGVGGDPEPV